MTNTLATTATNMPELGTTGANLIREAAAVMVDAHTLAKAVAGTQMIPKHFQGKPDECAAAMLYGASLGLDPMQSVRQIYVVHGQAALYARAMSALVQGAGHKVWTVESTDQSVTVSGSRKGSEHVETATWTGDRAKKAGYTNNAKYQTDPQAMLYSKALSEVCRKIAPDVLSGVFSVEEMQMERGAPQEAAQPRVETFTSTPQRATITPEQVTELEDLMDLKGVPMGDRVSGAAWITQRDITDLTQLTPDEADTITDRLNSRPDATEDEGGDPS